MSNHTKIKTLFSLPQSTFFPRLIWIVPGLFMHLQGCVNFIYTHTNHTSHTHEYMYIHNTYTRFICFHKWDSSADITLKLVFFHYRKYLRNMCKSVHIDLPGSF